MPVRQHTSQDGCGRRHAHMSRSPRVRAPVRVCTRFEGAHKLRHVVSACRRVTFVPGPNVTGSKRKRKDPSKLCSPALFLQGELPPPPGHLVALRVVSMLPAACRHGHADVRLQAWHATPDGVCQRLLRDVVMLWGVGAQMRRREVRRCLYVAAPRPGQSTRNVRGPLRCYHASVCVGPSVRVCHLCGLW